MAISGRPSSRDLASRTAAWAVVMVTYLTLWSAGPGWMTYWWAWLFVLLPVCLSGLGWRQPGPGERPADGFVSPRVRFPTPHRRRRGVVR
ncbi:MAG: hypothetical protein ACRDRV_09235 [Pseudonocardiaceae bacterium]